MFYSPYELYSGWKEKREVAQAAKVVRYLRRTNTYQSVLAKMKLEEAEASILSARARYDKAMTEAYGASNG